jgi:hypothetical protein
VRFFGKNIKPEIISDFQKELKTYQNKEISSTKKAGKSGGR